MMWAHRGKISAVNRTIKIILQSVLPSSFSLSLPHTRFAIFSGLLHILGGLSVSPSSSPSSLLVLFEHCFHDELSKTKIQLGISSAKNLPSDQASDGCQHDIHHLPLFVITPLSPWAAFYPHCPGLLHIPWEWVGFLISYLFTRFFPSSPTHSYSFLVLLENAFLSGLFLTPFSGISATMGPHCGSFMRACVPACVEYRFIWAFHFPSRFMGL